MMRALGLIPLLTMMSLMLSACSAGNQRDTAHTRHERAELAADEPADFSLYELQSEWTDQLGERRMLASLAGRPRVVALAYTSCAVACPRIISDMKRLESELGATADHVGFVLVSLDPARDTPARLREYAAAAQLEPARWTLLTASHDDVLELAVLLGVRYRRISDTDIEHSNVLSIVAADGRIVHRLLGLGADPAPGVRLLTSLAAPALHAH